MGNTAEHEDFEELNLDDEQQHDDAAPSDEDRGDDFTQDTPDDEQQGFEVDEDVLASIANTEDGATKIPKQRFDEVNEKRKAAEQENKELREMLARQISNGATVDFDFDEAYAKHAELIIEGETKEAAKLMGEIMQANRQQAKLEAELEVKVDTVEANTAKIAIEAFEAYPFLDPDSKEFNQEAYDKVNRFQDVYFKSGVRYDVALQQALADVAPMYSAAKSTDTTKPSGKMDALRRNAAAAKQQPPNISGVGTGDRGKEARVNVAEMSESEFDALPESEKKRLRGD